MACRAGSPTFSNTSPGARSTASTTSCPGTVLQLKIGKQKPDLARAVRPDAYGEPPSRGSVRSFVRIFPRAGGGTGSGASRRDAAYDLSPRGRGNPGSPERPNHERVTFPARAGEPVCARPDSLPERIFPRAGGGTHNPGPSHGGNLKIAPCRWPAPPMEGQAQTHVDPACRCRCRTAQLLATGDAMGVLITPLPASSAPEPAKDAAALLPRGSFAEA